MGDLSIGDVARRTGISASAIRYYERLSLLPTPLRRGGRRCYASSVVPRLLLIAAGRRAGLPLRDIRALLEAAASRAELGSALTEVAARVEHRIASLARAADFLKAASRCGCARPFACEMVAGIEREGS